jgi:hypothetical protein
MRNEFIRDKQTNKEATSKMNNNANNNSIKSKQISQNTISCEGSCTLSIPFNLMLGSLNQSETEITWMNYVKLYSSDTHEMGIKYFMKFSWKRRLDTGSHGRFLNSVFKVS